MKPDWHHIFGSATGPIRAFSPQTRILAGTLVFLTGMVVPPDCLPGMTVAISTLIFWFLLCRPKKKVVLAMILFGLVLFAPYFLLMPLIATDSHGINTAIAAPWRVFFRGMLTLLACIITISSLSLNEIGEGLFRLPIPGIVREIILQIVHQTLFMYDETIRIGQAMAVRGVSGQFRTSIRVLSTLPLVWLPRVIDRAERVAAAMEVRQYMNRTVGHENAAGCTMKDWMLLVGMGLMLLLAIGIRIG